MLRVGTVIYGYCEGIFGRDYGPKRVEAIGSDWVVVRDEELGPQLYSGSPEDLLKYSTEEECKKWEHLNNDD